ncbi:MAG: SUMF1/EgtB/PvdO family nonheme iron enzyme [Paludibacteraceae bacterium]|nr:SUMF1/EgtB/PvdO family nonheme iron enzyme [Paludibacteraceae bacterium]
MKRTANIILGVVCGATSLMAQEITNVEAKQVGNTVEVTYDLDKDAPIQLLLSRDGGANYTPEPQTITGDVGQTTAGHKKMVWDMLSDYTDWNVKNARFKVVVGEQKDKVFTVNKVPFTMISVEGGVFVMGATPEQGEDAEKTEKPAHPVALSDFYIGQTEVTQGLWRAVMGTSRSYVQEGDNYPVENVNWDDCQLFIDKINEIMAPELGGRRFALPTEAQWEYAARGGKYSKGYKYPGSNELGDVAWYQENSGGTTHPVGTKKANELGLFDMSGNIYEWCYDWHEPYPVDLVSNPSGPTVGKIKGLRGGSLESESKRCRITKRGGNYPDYHNLYNGFRLVLLPKMASATAQVNESNTLLLSAHKVLYFSDFAKPVVEKAINEWQLKDEFEKTADWQARVNETTRNDKIKELTKQAEADYLQKCTATLQPDVSLSGPYDADNEVFLLFEPRFGDMIVPVPISEARAFKQNWASVQISPQYFIENDVLSLASMDMYFPTLDKHYLYSNQASLKYEQAQVDYNFEPIKISGGSGTVQKGEQTIGQKKLAAGKSEVDLQIPETNALNPNTFVIIIANEDYKSVAPVPFALNDGRILAKYCQRTLGVPAANIKVHENATYNDIRLAMAWLKNVCEKYEGEASVIFYYTGHGIPDESDKSAYLLPVDGDGRYVATGYKMDDLYQKLGEMPTKSVTVLLDACFSGATRDGQMVAQAKGVALKTKRCEPQGNTVVLSAAQGDETAGFDEEQGHGMFTYFLLKKLQETKGDVTLDDLSQYVIREVGRKSAVTNKPQTPCITPSATITSNWQSWKLR